MNYIDYIFHFFLYFIKMKNIIYILIICVYIKKMKNIFFRINNLEYNYI